MKTIEEIKNEVAKKHGYDNWTDLICQMLHVGWRMTEFLKYENEAMQEYAKQCCDEHEKNILAIIDKATPNELPNGNLKLSIQILSTPNVAEKP